MPTRLNPTADIFRQNEADILGNSKDDSTSGNAGRIPQLNPDVGNAQTIAAVDGDLQTIDTAAEVLAVNLVANTSGNANAKYSSNLLLRAIGTLLQIVANKITLFAIKAANTPSLTTDSAIVVTTREVFSRYRNTALSSTPDQVKSSATALRGWNIINVNAVPVYVKFYDNLAASVTVGTTTPFLTLEVPPQVSDTPGCVYMEPICVQDRATTALTIACVTGLADSNTVAPTTGIHVSLRYE